MDSGKMSTPRSENKEQRLENLLQVSGQVSHILCRQKPVPKVLQKICDLLDSTGYFTACFVVLVSTGPKPVAMAASTASQELLEKMITRFNTENIVSDKETNEAKNDNTDLSKATLQPTIWKDENLVEFTLKLESGKKNYGHFSFFLKKDYENQQEYQSLMITAAASLTHALHLQHHMENYTKLVFFREKQLEQQKVLTDISAVFSGPLTHFSQKVRKVLRLIGIQFCAGRVYLAEDEEDNTICKITHQWFPDVRKKRHTASDNISYIEDIPSLKISLVSNGYLYAEDISALPDDLKRFCEKEKIKSVLFTPLSTGSSYYGFMAVEHHKESCIWEEAEVNFMLTAASIIAAALERRHVNQAIREHTRILTKEVEKYRHRERELAASEKKYRKIYETLPELYVSSSIDGKILDVAPNVSKHLGYLPEEVTGTCSIDYFVDPDQHAKFFEMALKYGKIVDYELHLKHRDGHTIYMAANSVIHYNSAGFPETVETVLYDITERKRAAQEIKASEERFRAVFEGAANLGIQGYTPDGKILFWNKGSENISGYKAEEILGKNILKLFLPKDDYEQTKKELQKAIKTNTPLPARERLIIHKDGTMVPIFSNQVITHPPEGEPVLFSINVDLTAQKKAEYESIKARKEAEQANQAKSMFLANMSHEIRTPMNAIIGMSHLILNTALTAKQEDYAKKIDTAAKSLLGVLNDILDFSKIEAGKLDIEAVRFSLSETLYSIANLAAVRLQNSAVEMHIQIPPAIPDTLIGDPLRLTQILTNLLSNAVKFTEYGSIVIYVALKEKTQKNITLEFHIKDTGIGINAKQKKKLFQPFTQVDASTTRKYGGTGLGLVISRQLAELMKGKISFDSTQGKGTTFTLTLNFGIPKRGDQENKHPLTEKDLKDARILVIDDNPAALETLKQILHSFSLRHHCVDNDQDASLALIKASKENDPYHIIIADFFMEEQGVLGNIAKIGSLALRFTPKYIFTCPLAYKDFPAITTAKKFHPILTKPVVPLLLLQSIQEAAGCKDDICTEEIFLNKTLPTLPKFENVRVLLVEDNEINQQIGFELLNNVGIDVTIKENGSLAFEVLKQEKFDLVLMDIRMPVMDGHTATKKIRAQNNAYLKKIPIIAMTAHAMVTDKKKSQAVGMNGHITKPVNPDELYSILLKWLPREKRTSNDIFFPKKKEKKGKASTFDPQQGIQHLGGNKELYISLLNKFMEKYIDSANLLKETFQAGNKEEAMRQAHSIKSVAGNLGAEKLQAIAFKVESAIKENSGYEKVLAEFKQSLAQAAEKIKAYLQKEQEHHNQEEEEKDGEQNELEKLLKELQPMLEDRKPVPCKNILKKLTGQSWPASLAIHLQKINEDVKRYNFKEALKNLEELKKLL